MGYLEYTAQLKKTDPYMLVLSLMEGQNETGDGRRKVKGEDEAGGDAWEKVEGKNEAGEMEWER